MHPLLRTVATLACVLTVYYAVPVAEDPRRERAELGLVVLLVSVAALAWLIAVQVKRQRQVADADVRVEGLMVLLFGVVAVFSAGYLLVARAAENQFVGMVTKTDALYFTVSTLATVGFGDVHATGQLARALVLLQIGFNLTVVGALVTTLTEGLRRRGAARLAAAHAAASTLTGEAAEGSPGASAGPADPGAAGDPGAGRAGGGGDGSREDSGPD